MHAILSLAVTWRFDLAQEGRKITQTKSLKKVTKGENVREVRNLKKNLHIYFKKGAMSFFLDNILTLWIYKN